MASNKKSQYNGSRGYRATSKSHKGGNPETKLIDPNAVKIMALAKPLYPGRHLRVQPVPNIAHDGIQRVVYQLHGRPKQIQNGNDDKWTLLQEGYLEAMIKALRVA
jgi:hypothetical protein